jgi:hypothetical protein
MYKQNMYNLTKEKGLEKFTQLPLVSPYGDLAQRTNEVKNLKKIANPQAFSVE